MSTWNPSTRRCFLSRAAAATAVVAGRSAFALRTLQPGASFLDLLRPPELVTAFPEDSQPIPLHRSGISWQAAGIELRTAPQAVRLELALTAPNLPLRRIHLRWQVPVDSSALYLGDAWERSYGDLGWRSLVPERVLPWYFAAHTSAGLTHGYGVRTGARALCFWQVDPEGVSLTLDVSNGGRGVLLGQRELALATVVTHAGQPGEHPTEALAQLCRRMCPNPRPSPGPIYGGNDWYYAYGRNSAEGILRDTDLLAALSPPGGSRPFSVIDDGWQPQDTLPAESHGNSAFPNMARLSSDIRGRGVRPGIWIRPTLAPARTTSTLLLPSSRFGRSDPSGAPLVYDPTIPEALDLILAKFRLVASWEYDLIKHDFSTYDLLGQWGFEMGAEPTRPRWSFHDRSRTNAEILLALYTAIRFAAGDERLLLGCNTIGHLGASLFDLQRTGDDTSGRQWERTRRMGVNTLAFRLPQNHTFFVIDADCVGITRDVPWSLNRQWLDLLARSGSALFISPAPDAVGPEQKAAITDAFAIAAGGRTTAYPLDGLTETTPEHWRSTPPTGSHNYTWCPPAGCNPSPV